MTTEPQDALPVALEYQQRHFSSPELSLNETTAPVTKMLQAAWSLGPKSDQFAADPRTLSLCIRFVDAEEGQGLNHEFRGLQSPTNVLSFETAFMDEAQCQHIGDLVLCAPVLAHEAEVQGKSLQAHYLHLVLHGILHLIGYDHHNGDCQQVMEQLEIKLLNEVGVANPYEVIGDE